MLAFPYWMKPHSRVSDKCQVFNKNSPLLLVRILHCWVISGISIQLMHLPNTCPLPAMQRLILCKHNILFSPRFKGTPMLTFKMISLSSPLTSLTFPTYSNHLSSPKLRSLFPSPSVLSLWGPLLCDVVWKLFPGRKLYWMCSSHDVFLFFQESHWLFL